MNNKRLKVDTPPASTSNTAAASSAGSSAQTDDAGLEGILELVQKRECLSRFQDFSTSFLLASMYPISTDELGGKYLNKVSYVLGTLTSLSMVFLGAKGKTRTSIACELGLFGLCSSEIETTLKDMFTMLQQMPVSQAELTISTRLAVSEEFYILGDFIEATKRAGVPSQSVLTFDSGCRDERKGLASKLKHWVQQVTNGGVSDFGTAVLPSTKLIVVTCGILQDSWKTTVEAGIGVFFPSAEEPEIEIGTLTVKGSFLFFQSVGDQCEAIVLPMKTPNLDFLILRPTGQGTIGDVFKKLLVKKDLLDLIYENCEENELSVTFPTFNESTGASVKDDLCKINLQTIFDRPDFSGMLNSKDIGLSDMYSLVSVKVDVDGVCVSGTSIARGRTCRESSVEDGRPCDKAKKEIKVETPFAFLVVAYQKIPIVGGMIFNPKMN